MFLPEDNLNATDIMIGTGTGVGPFRGYLRRMFMEAVRTSKFGGLAWLLLGVANNEACCCTMMSLRLDPHLLMWARLKGMMPVIQDTLKRVLESRGEGWKEKLSQLKKNKQWHVGVYSYCLYCEMAVLLFCILLRTWN
ncbi:hypothetical protein CASFOL_001162 [Castilleja foliolosa]|uniref:Oxidoreductase FAD/NAD(P)-binding domain-containing protein n=1 Tax=Castilleja foliolosa TaxID=1961234 RepID=A0ABD3EQ33_9LAMI